jgi:hypothetical protein
MSDFNRDIKLVITVIERTQAKSFFLQNIDCPWDCELEEFHSILQDVLTTTDFEQLVNDERKSRL